MGTKGKQIKILQVTSGFRKGVSGGIASAITNYCTTSIFDEKYVVDYLALGYQPFEPYRDMLEARESKLYSLDIHSQGNRRLLDIYTELKKFLRQNHYDIVHMNSGALTQVLAACFAAKAAGIGCVIAHSHNSLEKKGFRRIRHNILKPMFYLFADYYFACSELAAKSMFPKGILKNKKWTFIPNAIEADKYAFDEEIRNKYRKELSIGDSFVLGHVGRLNEQKNHLFLIDIFAEILRLIPNSKLLLVGTGDLEKEVKDKVNKMGLSENVIFTGQRKDVNCLLQVMDVFVFPSKWEGLPVTVVEAQANGLKCIISDQITREVAISELVEYLPIDNGSGIWAERICGVNSELYKRKNIVKGTKFDIANSAGILAGVYENCLKARG